MTPWLHGSLAAAVLMLGCQEPESAPTADARREASSVRDADIAPSENVPSEDGPSEDVPSENVPSESGPPGTRIAVDGASLEFSPKTCLRGQAGFGWGLGSVRVNVLGRDAGRCVFDFTDEIEGGYTVYRCRVPVEGPPVRIHEENSGIVTSFSLADAKVLRRGNLLLPPPEPPLETVSWKSQYVADAGYVNLLHDVANGAGKAAGGGQRVAIEYTAYADEEFDTPLIGIATGLTLEFSLGEGRVGRGLEMAVEGMQVGGKRRAILREEVAGGVAKQLGGVQPGTRLALEIELMRVE
ncbi:MAG: FKBP-type peptidyl-prolyl cis-trans isomerase [Pirellulaceae bacterium]